MPVGLTEPAALTQINGVRLASIACGIKNNGNDDLVVFQFDEGSVCASVFTQNAFCAAPVVVAKKHLALTSPRYFLINSGNANAGTGEQGLLDARLSCQHLADISNCLESEVIPFSTGVIGETLPMDKLCSGIESIVPQLAADNWLAAARGIKTTDIVAKAVSEQVEVNGETITITGITKGSGMIHPNMATMLCFIATDANIDKTLLQNYLNRAVEKSFNSITVDGDTSTNDACMLVATGKTQQTIEKETPGAQNFYQALDKVCTTLAQAIVRDGEGATKFVSVDVSQAKTYQEAKQVAYTIALSPLVKTALFASDPNWGRILAAVGRSGVKDFDIDKVNIYLDEVCIVEAGGKSVSYTEEQGQRVMNQAEITIRVELARGDESAVVWTTDLSHDYVTINSEYRS